MIRLYRKLTGILPPHEQVDDAKSNRVDLRQSQVPSTKSYCDTCEPFNICLDNCIEEERRGKHL